LKQLHPILAALAMQRRSWTFYEAINIDLALPHLLYSEILSRFFSINLPKRIKNMPKNGTTIAEYCRNTSGLTIYVSKLTNWNVIIFRFLCDKFLILA
jgi:hypothetical protein